jgi:hypothetical protein
MRRGIIDPSDDEEVRRAEAEAAEILKRLVRVLSSNRIEADQAAAR